MAGAERPCRRQRGGDPAADRGHRAGPGVRALRRGRRPGGLRLPGRLLPRAPGVQVSARRGGGGAGGRWGHPSPLTSAPPPPPAPSHPGPSTGPAARRRPLPRRRRKRKAATGEAGESCHRPAGDGRRTVGPPGAHPSAGKAPTPHCGPRPSLNPSALTESLPFTALPPQEPLPFTRPLPPLSTHPYHWHSPAPELDTLT